MLNLDDIISIPEEQGISIKNESSLHSLLKIWYSFPGDRFEVKVDGYIIDIVRDNLLIEIQTKNFTAIRKKLSFLAENHRILLVHPIAEEKWIVKISKSGDEIVSKRKSPKKGKLIDVFDELIRMPSIINEENISLEILLIKEEDVICQDGKGSWRRRGDSLKDKKLVEVYKRQSFSRKEDFLIFLPDRLSYPFSNKLLAEVSNISVKKSQKVTYCLRKMGLIKEVGKIRNELLFDII